MKQIHLRMLFACFISAGGLVAWVVAAPRGAPPVSPPSGSTAAESPASADEQEIRAAVASYVQAFNRGDAKAMASQWTETGEYISPDGDRVNGRQNLEKEFVENFATEPGRHVEILDYTVRQIAPGVAVEEGRALMTRAGDDPDETTYLAIHVKKDGKWLLDSIRETEVPGPPSAYGRLTDLSWLIGEWVDQSPDSTVETAYRWAPKKNFILAKFQVKIKDQLDLEGTQFIGWDPAAKTIRSWYFDSDGGFGEGTWTHKDNLWIVRSSNTVPDGQHAAALNIYRQIDANSYGWKSVSRKVGDDYLPNIDEVKVVRKQTNKG